MDRCDACGGSFDAVSRRGVAVNMGPWYLHDERVPFRPGFSYTSMKRLISAGKVSANSVIRGPTTQQLWAPARLTPGIAHLVGHCPRCEANVAPQAAACPQCAQRFEPVAAHNELGLPFAGSAQAREAQAELDREVARSGGRSRALKLWHNPDVPMLALCPYCGDWQKSHDHCDACGGVFDQLSQRATVIAMGPWFVRNKRFPYLPGCSYAVLRQQVEAERIDAGTILRGPTTRQFWSVAKNVPGVSHLVGFCWSCGAPATTGDARCGSCGSPFGGVDAANALGLAFATEAEALAAEQELEAQFNPMMPPTPVLAPAPPIGTGTSHAAVGQAMFSGLDRASLAVIAAARVDEPDRAEALPSTRSNAPVPVARQRRRARRRSHPAVVAALVALVAAGAITAIILIAGNSGKPAPSADGATPPVVVGPAKDGAGVTPTPPVAVDAKAVREKAMAAWTAVRDVGREGQVGLRLDNLGDLMARADAAFADGTADRAATVYADAIAQIEALQPRLRLRDDATAARGGAAELLVMTDPTDLPPAGVRLIETTKLQFDEAQIYFDNGQFEQARDLWTIVEAGLVNLPERANGLETVDAARKAYQSTLDADLDDATLDAAGGEAWFGVTDLVSAARKAEKDEQWSEAVAAYGKAAELAPAVMKTVKPIAVRYWTVQAGLLASRAWREHVDGETLDPKARAALRPMLARLKVPMDAIDKATLEPVTKEALKDILFLDTLTAVKTTHGDAAGASYCVGGHLAAISVELKNSDLEEAESELLQRMQQFNVDADEAGFTEALHREFAGPLAKAAGDFPNPAAVEEAQKMFALMLASLGDVSQVARMSRP